MHIADFGRGTETQSDRLPQQATAVYALLLACFSTFVADNLLHLPFTKALYLYHRAWAWWQWEGFLEMAALHRKVVVLVDACESARCAPYAGVGATAVAGLDPRENAPASEEEEETRDSRRETLGSSSRLEERLETRDDASLAASNAHLVDLRAHFEWLPQSPPLAVRFVLACREDGGDDGGDDEKARPSSAQRAAAFPGNDGPRLLSVARAIASGAPASRALYAMPPMTVEQTRAVLASATPAPLGNPKREGGASALERGHHHNPRQWPTEP